MDNLRDCRNFSYAEYNYRMRTILNFQIIEIFHGEKKWINGNTMITKQHFKNTAFYAYVFHI